MASSGFVITAVVFASAIAMGHAYQVSDPCNGAVPLFDVINNSYDEQLNLIKRGVPSEVVSFFFDETFERIGSNGDVCLCSLPGVDDDVGLALDCLVANFMGTESYVVRQLHDALQIDKNLKKKKQLFPFYHKSNGPPFPTLPEDIMLTIEEQKAFTIQNVYEVLDSLSGFSPLSAPTSAASIYADDADLLVDGGEMKFCKDYELGSKTVPATLLITYTFGASAHAVFANGKLGNIKKMIKTAISQTFKAARCQRKSGSDLDVPIALLETIRDKAEKIIAEGQRVSPLSNTDQKRFDRLAPLTDLAKMLRLPRVIWADEIWQICSTVSYGRPVYLDVSEMGLVNIIDILREDLEYYWGQYTSIFAQQSARLPGCKEGWAKVERLTAVVHYMENCCPLHCMKSGADPFFGVLETETCCVECNGFECSTGVDAIQAVAFDPRLADASYDVDPDSQTVVV